MHQYVVSLDELDGTTFRHTYTFVLIIHALYTYIQHTFNILVQHAYIHTHKYYIHFIHTH